MMNRFEELLKELGREYSLSLHPDHRGACQLNIEGILHVQLSCEEEKERLLIACFICETPAGKFRENILKTALKHNYLQPLGAILAYSEKNNQLTLFQYIPLASLQGKGLVQPLNLFIAKAKEWRTGVETGALQTLLSSNAPRSSGMFGL